MGCSSPTVPRLATVGNCHRIPCNSSPKNKCSILLKTHRTSGYRTEFRCTLSANYLPILAHFATLSRIVSAKTRKPALDRRRLFARLYFIDKTHNATKAYIAAGYSKGGARQAASKLLATADVRALLEKWQAAAEEKYDLTGARVLKELTLLGFANMADFVEGDKFIGFDALSRDRAAAVQEVTFDGDGGVRVKLSNKREALELLGKHLKLFGADDHGASAAVKVIIVDVTRPGRPAVGVAMPDGVQAIDIAPVKRPSPANDAPAIDEAKA